MWETRAIAREEVSVIFGLFCEYVGLCVGDIGLFCDRALLQRHASANVRNAGNSAQGSDCMTIQGVTNEKVGS